MSGVWFPQKDLGFVFPQSQVEYAISVLEVDDIGTQSSQTVLRWATEQIPGLHGF